MVLHHPLQQSESVEQERAENLHGASQQPPMQLPLQQSESDEHVPSSGLHEPASGAYPEWQTLPTQVWQQSSVELQG